MELSHINYTEILKQCLAAVSSQPPPPFCQLILILVFQGYEYFGYDPATYYSSDQDGFPQECSYVIEDGHSAGLEEDAGSGSGDRAEQPVLEIDLDQVNEEKQNACGGKNVGRNDPKQILCK